MTSTILENYAELYEYPDLDVKHPPDAKNQLTLGDLHANAIKFIYFLIRQNILLINKNDYKKLISIYKKKSNKLKKDDLNVFSDIILNAKCNNLGTIRLIGDDIADRGNNDYFIWKIIEKLGKENIQLEIIASNHSNQFIENYECSKSFDNLTMDPEFTHSMHELHQLIKRGLVDKSEIFSIYENHYKPCYKAISFTLNEDKSKISIYSHAAIGLDEIKKMAQKMKVKYSDQSAESLGETINRINGVFDLYKENNILTNLYDWPSTRENPFSYSLENREYEGLYRPIIHTNGYYMDFIHGHDSNENTARNICNLDNTLGKGDHYFSTIGRYHILYSQETGVTHPGYGVDQKTGLYRAPKRLHEIKPYESIWPYDTQKDWNRHDGIIQDLFKKIDAMGHYGVLLTKEDKPKGQAVIKLARGLRREASFFFIKNHETPEKASEALVSFQKRFLDIIKKKDNEMEIHRKKWKCVMANLMIAITGIGALAQIVNLAYSKYVTGEATLFFSKTTRHSKLEKIEKTINRFSCPAA
ncbi:MAG: hypothetical protein P4M14_02600 [Gammaproteobacteria bacterium]|nr:hypothetical protein [Gammaproteobacteria bacterium]